MSITSKSHLTANTLFHYTNSLDKLLSILKNNFYPKYSLEEGLGLTLGNRSIKLALPMVCFCDIPLSQIENHSSTYGSYALGLSKEWGIKNRINPVMYCYEESASIRNIYNLLTKLGDSEENDTNNLIDSDVFPFLFYIKPYMGSLWKNGKVRETNVVFYNEKEWRYVPYFIEEGRLNIKKQWLNESKYHDNKSRKAHNSLLENDKDSLKFRPGDIKYIVVNKETERDHTRNQIIKIKKPNYTRDQINILTTRIISMDQILDDF